ncbi:MAG: malate dehydrogenase [Nitrososphaerales archaeon]
MHIAQIGTGRVGRPTAYSILSLGLADELTVCDIKDRLASAFAEELRHAAASMGLDTEIIDATHASEVSGADVILISAGRSRRPGERITRRDLTAINAKTVREVAEATRSGNRGARYIVITNPVDAMAMICKKYSGADFVISTSTSLESSRFRAKLAAMFDVPVSMVQGWVGGEHGSAAVPLWSQTRICGFEADEYAKMRGFQLDKGEVERYVKEVSEFIIEEVGATEYGPASIFARIVRAIVKNTDEFIPVATPMKFSSLPEPIYVGCPTRLGLSIGPNLYEALQPSEKRALEEAAKIIYQTYLQADEACQE